MPRAEKVMLSLGAALLACAAATAANGSMGSLAPRSSEVPGTSQQEWVSDPRTNCRALDADFDVGDTIQWQGECASGMINGAGALSFLNNGRVLETVTGTFGSGALLPGHVSATWSDGSRYDGEQSNGQFEGAGDFVSATGDKIDGAWKAGALNGKATVIWANGDRYDGDWKDGKSDGQGTEVWANGHRFEGLWKGGAPVKQSASGQNRDVTASLSVVPEHTAASAPLPSSTIAGETPTAPHVVPTVGVPPDVSARAAATLPLHDFLGKTLVAVDGSTIDLEQSDGGLTREVTLPTGITQQTDFSFLNDRIGTVSNGSATIGLFRVTGEVIETNYLDGKTEAMKPEAGSGILLSLRSTNGTANCTAWYPQGHAFSQDEKKAAVEEYASRLGVGDYATSKKHRTSHTASSACGGGFVTTMAATGTQTAGTTPLAQLSPAPGERFDTDIYNHGSGLQAIPVKDSPVHLIDAPYEPIMEQKPVQDARFGLNPEVPQAPALPSTSTGLAAQPVSDASQCLSVANSDGYWGFQNKCGSAVQFAYCEMSDENPLISCHHTSVAGSVAANGFSALINERSLSEQAVDHEFRWMACDGGAGEVVPHLDNVNPPSGRCLRAVPIASGTNRNPAGS